jgi:hypothetical protein
MRTCVALQIASIGTATTSASFAAGTTRARFVVTVKNRVTVGARSTTGRTLRFRAADAYAVGGDRGRGQCPQAAANPRGMQGYAVGG